VVGGAARGLLKHLYINRTLYRAPRCVQRVASTLSTRSRKKIVRRGFRRETISTKLHNPPTSRGARNALGTIEYQFRVTQSRAHREGKAKEEMEGGEGRSGKKDGDRSAFRAELVHTNFLIPPRSLASGCVTGAHAACCVLSSSVLCLSLSSSISFSSTGTCTRAPPFTYITTKDRQFYTCRTFFNREKGRRGEKRTEGERGGSLQLDDGSTNAGSFSFARRRLSIQQKLGIWNAGSNVSCAIDRTGGRPRYGHALPARSTTCATPSVLIESYENVGLSLT